MDIEDHIPQEREVTLRKQIADLLLFEDFDGLGELLTDTLIDFFDYYRTEPILYRMLNIANHVRVERLLNENVNFNLRRRSMTLTPEVASVIESGHDLACLMLVERSRLIVNRQAHTILPDGMDLKNQHHKVVFDLARACWSNALARCYCASTLPERLYAPHFDFMSCLQHGLAPDHLYDALVQSQMPNTAAIYMRLYQMGGQEQYHAALNRMPACGGTINFDSVIESFWLDFESMIAEYESEMEKRKQQGEGGDCEKGNSDSSDETTSGSGDPNADDNNGGNQPVPHYELVKTDDGDDDKPENLQEKMEKAKKDCGKGGHMSVVAVTDIDADSEIDAYIAEVIVATGIDNSKRSYWGTGTTVPNVGAIREVFQPLAHSALMQVESEEDAFRYGSPIVPHRPACRDLAMRMQGHSPLVWETQMLPRHDTRNTSEYALYNDVSGSQFSWIPYVRALARQLGVFTHPDHVYVFSDDVADLDVNAPFVKSSGGTEIKSVFDHAKKHGLANIILVTDLQDYTKVGSSEGIDHVICIVTDTDSVPDVSKTVLSTLSPNTKLDLFPIQLSSLTKRVRDRSGNVHFSENPTGL